jgi:two-component system chemotaxis response regulator CheY
MLAIFRDFSRIGGTSLIEKECCVKTKSDYPDVNQRVPDGQKPDGSSYKILIVDDSIFVKKQLSRILSSEGYEIADTASDGAEALDKYKSLYPNIDLVTMDITMPGMDGVTALEKIVEYDSDARIVMVSALGKQDLVKKSFMLGAKNYIIKPLDRTKVLERLRNVLQNS